MDWIEHWKDLAEFISYVVVILGVPFAFWRHYRTTQKEERDREYAIYSTLDDKYIEFQKLCLEHPYLDVFDISYIPQDWSPNPSSETKKEEMIAFTMLFAIFERAFQIYRDASTDFSKRQWLAWDKYIKSYSHRQNFLSAWKESGKYFDKEFYNYMNEILEDAKCCCRSRNNASGIGSQTTI